MPIRRPTTSEPDWAHFTSSQLLELRFCDLGPLDPGLMVEKALASLDQRLRRRRLVFRPHVWVSTEWFCPDGVPGFAVPFYLCHPRLLRLQRELLHFAEGTDAESCRRMVFHECGHAIDNAYRLRRDAARVKLFGSPARPYPLGYCPDPKDRRFVSHLDDHYAQSHPDEDFAETFAVWLGPKAAWRHIYRSTRALEKLELMDRIMEDLKGQPSYLSNQRTMESTARSQERLSNYFRRRRAELGLKPPRQIEAQLQKVFHRGSPSAEPARRFIWRQARPLAQELAPEIGHPTQVITLALRRLALRAGELGLRCHRSPRQNLGPLRDLARGHLLAEQARGRLRILI